MIGIITATVQEFEALNKALGTNKTGTMVFIKGSIGGHKVVGVQAGIGKVNAALCAQKMIDLFHPDYIVNVGVAGALNEGLKVGDVVISRDAVQHDFDTTFFGDSRGYVSGFDQLAFDADKRLITAAETAAKELEYSHCIGRIASGDQFIADRDKKRDLIDTFQADCCEMEGASVAQVCVVNRTPFVILRAISDGADDGAGMSYLEFVEFAAQRATKLIMKMLEYLKR